MNFDYQKDTYPMLGLGKFLVQGGGNRYAMDDNYYFHLHGNIWFFWIQK